MTAAQDPAAGAPTREGGGDRVSPAPPAAAPSPVGGGSPTPPARPRPAAMRGHAESLDCWCSPVLMPTFPGEWTILHGDVTQLRTAAPVPAVVASIAAEVEGPYLVHEATQVCVAAVEGLS